VLNFSVTFLITIVNIAILVLVLKKLLFKPVQKFMAERTRKVREELDGAATAKSVAEDLKTRYEGLLADAEREAESVIKEAEARGKEEAKAIIAKAEAEAVEIRHRAEDRAAFELRRARDELAGEVAKLAVAAASHVTGRSMSSSDDLAEAEAFVRGVGADRG
jgi:F-type H+-transporting ATPase subunit b